MEQGLKATGTYLSRALSYNGAEFSIAKVEIDPQFQASSILLLSFSSGIQWSSLHARVSRAVVAAEHSQLYIHAPGLQC